MERVKMQDLSKLPAELRPLYEDLYKSQNPVELIRKAIKIELATRGLSKEKQAMEEDFLYDEPMGIYPRKP